MPGRRFDGCWFGHVEMTNLLLLDHNEDSEPFLQRIVGENLSNVCFSLICLFSSHAINSVLTLFFFKFSCCNWKPVFSLRRALLFAGEFVRISGRWLRSVYAWGGTHMSHRPVCFRYMSMRRTGAQAELALEFRIKISASQKKEKLKSLYFLQKGCLLLSCK